MKKSKIFALLVSLALVVTMFAGCSGDAETSSEGEGGGGGETYLSIATGGTSGTYYPLGGAISNVIDNNVEGVSAQAESTGASVENAQLIQSDETDIAMVQNDIAYYAATGTELEAFSDGELDNVKGLSILYPEVIQIVALADSGIESVEDLAGKSVAVGAPGSGTEANARQVLDAHGLSFDDLGQADPLSFAEASEQMRNEQIDAAFVTAGIPTAAITEVSTVSDIVVVPIESSVIQDLNEQYPFYTEFTIPAGSYTGQEEDIVTATVMSMLIVRDNMEEETVYEITKAIFENLDAIGAAHEKGTEISLETANQGMPIDLHPGALKYYEEVGAPLE